MKKNILLLMIILLTSFNVFTQDSFNAPPIASSGWYWEDGITLKGEVFTSVAKSYREQEGYAVVLNEALHYWLYDTYTYHDGDIYNLLVTYIPIWIEKIGYVIDYDNSEEYAPNNDLANGVKILMQQRECDVSVTIVYYEWGDFLIINKYDRVDGAYTTWNYPLVEINKNYR